MLPRGNHTREIFALFFIASFGAQLVFADECSSGEVPLPDDHHCPLTVVPTCTGTILQNSDGIECTGTWCVAAEHEDACTSDGVTGPSAVDQCLRQFDENFPMARIVGGHEVKVRRKYPFMVSLVWANQLHFCGGTLIDSEWVLTAAHCVDFLSAGSPVTAQVGVHDRSQVADDSCVENIPLAEIRIHGSYSPNTLANDIALLRLQVPSAYPPVIGISTSAPRAFEHLVIAGWGALEYEGPSPAVLHEADLIYLDRRTCIDNSFYIEDWIRPGMTCAWFPQRDSCQGDSGGPLFRIAKNPENPAPQLFHLVGIVSWGIECAAPGWPGVYVNVRSYLPWLANQLPSTVYNRLVFSGWAPDDPPELNESGGPFDTAAMVPCEPLESSNPQSEGSLSYPPNPRDLYSNDQSCLFEIRTPAGHHVQLDFSRFELELSFDFLLVYEGGAEDAQLRAMLTGVSALHKPRNVDMTQANWIETLQYGNRTDASVPFADGGNVREKVLWRRKAELQQRLQKRGDTNVSQHLLDSQLRHVEYLIGRPPQLDLSRRRLSDAFDGFTGYPTTMLYIASPNVTLQFVSDGSIVDRGFALQWASVDPLRDAVVACDDASVTCFGDVEELEEAAEAPVSADEDEDEADGEARDDGEESGEGGVGDGGDGKEQSPEEETNGTNDTTPGNSGRMGDDDDSGVLDDPWSVGAIALLTILIVMAVGALLGVAWWRRRRTRMRNVQQDAPAGVSQQPSSAQHGATTDPIGGGHL